MYTVAWLLTLLTSFWWTSFEDAEDRPGLRTRPHTLLSKVEVEEMAYRHQTQARASWMVVI